LKECAADLGSFESGFFCVVGSPRQDPYCGQSQEEAYHHCG
jgi:hypothetical protein